MELVKLQKFVNQTPQNSMILSHQNLIFRRFNNGNDNTYPLLVCKELLNVLTMYKN